MTTNFSKKSALGAAVLALLANSFNAQADITDASKGATAYDMRLSTQMSNAIGVDRGDGLAANASIMLEDTLNQPSSKPRVRYYPEDATVTELRVVTAVTDKNSPAYVCVEGEGHFNKWVIDSNGTVTENKDTMPVAQGNKTPCQSWIVSAIKGQKPPVAKTTLKP
jgi:hypothetical protein